LLARSIVPDRAAACASPPGDPTLTALSVQLNRRNVHLHCRSACLHHRPQVQTDDVLLA